MNAFKLLILASTTGIASHTLVAELPSSVAGPAPQAAAATAAPQVRVGRDHKTAAPVSTLDELWAVEFTRGARKILPSDNPPLDGLWDVKFTRSARGNPIVNATSDSCGGCGLSKAAMAAGQPCEQVTK